MFMENVEKLLKLFDRVYVSSDSQLILDKAHLAGAIPIWRGQKLCGDTPNITVYQHALSKMGEVDALIAVQANSPNIDINTIAIVKRIMEIGIDEVMTCHSNYAIYGSVWAVSKKRLVNYKDPYQPTPQVLVLDNSVDIHSWDEYEEALKYGN